MSISKRRLTALLATLTTTVTLSIPAGSAFAATARAAPAGHATSPRHAASAAHPAPATHAPASGYESLPNLPVNSCQDSSLPRDYGTNFPVPSDPNGSATPTRP